MREPLDVCDIISMLAIFSGVTIVSVVTVSSSYTENSLDALAKNALGNPVFIVLGCITAVFDAFWISVHLVRAYAPRQSTYGRRMEQFGPRYVQRSCARQTQLSASLHEDGIRDRA